PHAPERDRSRRLPRGAAPRLRERRRRMAPLNALLPLLAALSAPSALAAGQGEAVFARVTQRNFGHQEEVSIRFTPEKAVLVLNSNFLQAPGVPARLGVWEAPLNEALKI